MQLSAFDWLVKVDQLLTMSPIYSPHSILLISISLKEIMKVSYRDLVFDGDDKCKKCHETGSLRQNPPFLISLSLSYSLVFGGYLSHISL